MLRAATRIEKFDSPRSGNEWRERAEQACLRIDGRRFGREARGFALGTVTQHFDPRHNCRAKIFVMQRAEQHGLCGKRRRWSIERAQLRPVFGQQWTREVVVAASNANARAPEIFA